MAGNDRKRQIARERYERRQAERVAARAKARQRMAIGGSAAGVVVIVVVVLLVVLLGGKSSKKTSASSSPSPSGSASTSASPTPPIPTTAPGCTTKPSVVASPLANFPLLPAGVSSALQTEPVVTVPAGKVPTTLQVKDLVVGTGPAVTTADSVTVNYLGVNYVDCTEFDSSWSRDSDTTFALNAVIPGFTDGIAGSPATPAKAATASASAVAAMDAIPAMKVGGRREIIVPPSFGYGAAGSPPKVAGNEELIFVVDVLAAGKTPSTSSAAASPAVTVTPSAAPASS